MFLGEGLPALFAYPRTLSPLAKEKLQSVLKCTRQSASDVLCIVTLLLEDRASVFSLAILNGKEMLVSRCNGIR